MKKALLSLGMILGLLAATPAAYAGGHHNHGHHNNGHHNHGHHNGGHHQHNNGFRGFPIPIPIPVPVPNPYPSPYCTPGYDCYDRAPIRVWVTEYEYRQYPYPHQVRYQRLVTAKWDKYRGGYWYWNNQGQYVRVR